MVSDLKATIHNAFFLPLTIAFCVFVAAGGMLDTIVGIIFRLYLALIALMSAQSLKEKFA